MGCDIHVIVQRQNGTEWDTLGPFIEEWRVEYEPDSREWPRCPETLTGRNYNLFGILADVRNARGFGGAVTGSRWKSIAPARGLPDGVTAPDDYSLGDHSFTWVTLAELQAWPWDTERADIFGVMSVTEYAQWKASGNLWPRRWCQDIHGPGIQIVDEAAFADLADADRDTTTRWHIRARWSVTARQAARGFVEEVLPWLAQFDPDPARVRLVMGFDS